MLTECIDSVMNRAMDELDRLSVSMLARTESFPTTASSSGELSPAKLKKSKKSVSFGNGKLSSRTQSSAGRTVLTETGSDVQSCTPPSSSKV